jgi:hypothetical protein
VRSHRGLWGTAVELEIPATAPQATCQWLITAPVYHPLWSQYALGVISLTIDLPDLPPAKLRFPGATHELFVAALNPEYGPWTPETAIAGIRWLEPINIVEQWTATDDEMREMANLCAWGVTAGHLIPETADAPAAIRAAWLTSMVKTLAHIRGEEHAS